EQGASRRREVEVLERGIVFQEIEPEALVVIERDVPVPRISDKPDDRQMRIALGEAMARRVIAELFTGDEPAQELGEEVAAGPLEVQEDELVRRDHVSCAGGRNPGSRGGPREARSPGPR